MCTSEKVSVPRRRRRRRRRCRRRLPLNGKKRPFSTRTREEYESRQDKREEEAEALGPSSSLLGGGERGIFAWDMDAGRVGRGWIARRHQIGILSQGSRQLSVLMREANKLLRTTSYVGCSFYVQPQNERCFSHVFMSLRPADRKVFSPLQVRRTLTQRDAAVSL